MQLRDIKAIGMAQNLPVKPLNDEPNRNNSKGRKVSNTVLGLGVAALLATGIGGVSAMGSSNAGLSQGLGGVAGFAEAGDYFAAAVATGDFNGDGRDDLLVGAPQENIGSLSNAGAFHVLYGSANGVSATGDVVLHQDSDSVVGVGEVEDLVGTSVASGDFNGDGFDDVAVGAPGENVGSLVDAGGVHVFYGSASGLTATGDQFLHQDASGVAGVAEAYDEFGFSLAAGDFNGDGRDDLAVGAPGEGIGSKAAAGGMHIFYGTTNGLSTGNDVFLHQDSKNVAGTAEAGDMMGETLAAGDFDADGIDDLVAGAPGEGIGSKTAAGGIHLLYGSGNGISTAGNVFWHQDTAGIDGSAEPDDRFGAALAVGDFDGSGGDDLAVGAPGEDLGSIGDAGGVHILYSIGSGDGLSTAGDDFVHQDSAGVPGQAEPGDEFGRALAAGDLNADGRAELVVGSPGEGVSGIPSAGILNLFNGTGSGLVADSQSWHQGDPNVAGDPESNNGFGSSITVGDFDGNGLRDVATGAPFDTVGGIGAAGSVLVLYS